MCVCVYNFYNIYIYIYIYTNILSNPNPNPNPLVYINECDLRPEELWSQPIVSAQRKQYEKGARFIQTYSGIFKDYLFCDKQVYVEIEGGFMLSTGKEGGK